MKSENPVLGHIFPYICGIIGPIVSKNNNVRPWIDSYQPCKFHRNRLKTATCIMGFYTYKYILLKI